MRAKRSLYITNLKIEIKKEDSNEKSSGVFGTGTQHSLTIHSVNIESTQCIQQYSVMLDGACTICLFSSVEKSLMLHLMDELMIR